LSPYSERVGHSNYDRFLVDEPTPKSMCGVNL
jgi:hypothetical protein